MKYTLQCQDWGSRTYFFSPFWIDWASFPFIFSLRKSISSSGALNPLCFISLAFMWRNFRSAHFLSFQLKKRDETARKGTPNWMWFTYLKVERLREAKMAKRQRSLERENESSSSRMALALSWFLGIGVLVERSSSIWRLNLTRRRFEAV